MFFANLPLEGFSPKADDLIIILPLLTVLGFLIGTFGHINKSRPMIILGIAIIFTATLILPLLTFRGDT